MSGRYSGPGRTITYSCGHTDSIRKDTTLGEIVQAIGGPCPTCTFQETTFPELEPKPKFERKVAKPRRKKP